MIYIYIYDSDDIYIYISSPLSQYAINTQERNLGPISALPSYTPGNKLAVLSPDAR